MEDEHSEAGVALSDSDLEMIAGRMMQQLVTSGSTRWHRLVPDGFWMDKNWPEAKRRALYLVLAQRPLEQDGITLPEDPYDVLYLLQNRAHQANGQPHRGAGKKRR